MISLNGIFAPLVTPFAANGDIDTAAFAFNIRAHLDSGLSGVVIAGSTGEAALLDESERSSLVEVARDILPKNKTLIVGAGAESTRYANRLARNAAARGADAVLVVAPHYYSAAMTSDALLRHYRAVADASPIPVILYNIPKYMHFAIPPHVVTELARHPNIIGIRTARVTGRSWQDSPRRSRRPSRSSAEAVPCCSTRSASVPPAAFSVFRCSRRRSLSKFIRP